MPTKTNKKVPEKQAAQYLANLLGRNVAGIEPNAITEDPDPEQVLNDLLVGKRKVEGFDIEKCLSNYSSWPLDIFLPYIIVAYLLRIDDMRKIEFINDIDPDIFLCNKFARYLYTKVKELIQENEFSVERIQNSIEDCGQDVFGYPLSPILKLSLYTNWFKTLDTDPTSQQFNLALSILRANKAKGKVV